MNQLVTVRPARDEDVLGIWRLLHSNCKCISTDNLTKNVQNFYVLLHGTKLLSVYDDSPGSMERHQAATVHPLYPEKLLGEIIANVVKNVILINKKPTR